jgi:hypothetical protein
VVVQDGKQPVYLVTNLPKSRLNDRQVVMIYGARWGVEVFFRTFKQTFGYRKLRSRSASNAQLELEWALIGLWGVCLLGTRELHPNGPTPARLSPAAASTRSNAPCGSIGCALTPLRRCCGSSCAAPDWMTTRAARRKRVVPPHAKHRSLIGIPHIVQATDQQIAQAAALQHQPAFRLAA